MPVKFILTAFSPQMFGEKATVHIRIVDKDEAQSLVSERTRVMATRPTHELLARKSLDNLSKETVRYAHFEPGDMALMLHYRGPPIGQSGDLPTGGMVTFYLIEVETYEEP